MTNWPLIHGTLAYFALMMTIISFWVKRSPWIWGSFLIFALILGYFAKLVEPIALIPIGSLLILHTLLKGDIRGLARFILVILAVAVSLGLWFRLWPGFQGWQILDNVKISEDGAPFNLYIHFSKPFIGIFVLACGLPLVKSWREFGNILKLSLPLIIGGIAIMILLSLYSGLIRFDPKFPPSFWFFAIRNLVIVSVIEEAFMRGFIQNEFFRWFGGKGAIANTSCVLVTAFLFAALHYAWVPSIPFLGLVFVAVIIYGSIYQYTKSIEASILCHWLFNITHFLFFTYPILQSAL